MKTTRHRILVGLFCFSTSLFLVGSLWSELHASSSGYPDRAITVVTGMTATVTAITADGRPAEAAFRFDVPLEDAALRWLWWHDGEFRPFTPPAVGQTMEIPPAVLRWW